MAREIVISSGDTLRMISLEQDERETQSVPLDRAGALCTSESHIICACDSVIWQFDRKRLMPTGLFGGGPGMCSLLLSQDGMHLFALCGEADSVLMISTQSGEPILLNKAGVNPREMALDGEILAIAGGESGLVLILCAHSLNLLDVISMPGPVYSVAIGKGTLHALCLTAELSSLLVTQKKGETRCMLALAGMPGRLLRRQNCLFAATDGAMYAVSPDGRRILRRINIPGRAVWMADAGDETLLLDGYTERLFAVKENNVRLLALHAAYAALC